MSAFTCGATYEVRIGNQSDQVARCTLRPGHDGQHSAVVLDSDDNAIPYRWARDDDAMGRGRLWAADCGIDYAPSGTDRHAGQWLYVDADATCQLCTGPIPAGRLVLRGDAGVSHVRCADPSTKGVQHDETHAGKWHANTRRLTKCKGDASTANPTAAAAVKALDKMPLLPRFTVSACESATVAKNWARYSELRAAARRYGMRAATGGPGRRVVPEVAARELRERTARKAPAVEAPAKVAPVEYVPAVDDRPTERCKACERAGRRMDRYVDAECPGCGAPPTPEVVYREVPKVAEPVAERLERIARVIDHFPAEVVTVPLATLPANVEEWLSRLVFGEKASYARAWAEHVLLGADAPADPGAEWAVKARKRLAAVTK